MISMLSREDDGEDEDASEKESQRVAFCAYSANG